jgi:hypothetical protein
VDKLKKAIKVLDRLGFGSRIRSMTTELLESITTNYVNGHGCKVRALLIKQSKNKQTW